MAKPDMDRNAPLTKEAMGIAPGLPLQASEGGVEELRRDIQRLMDIEAIKQLKHAYFRCIDTANFDELETLFHDDITVHLVGGFYEWKLQGKEEFMASQRRSFHQQAVGHHNGHQPEIQILSETEATGIWYLTDNMWVLNHAFFTDRHRALLGPLREGRVGLEDQGDALPARLRDQSPARGAAVLLDALSGEARRAHVRLTRSSALRIAGARIQPRATSSWRSGSSACRGSRCVPSGRGPPVKR